MRNAGTESTYMAVAITLDILNITGIIMIVPLCHGQLTKPFIVAVRVTNKRCHVLSFAGLKLTYKIYKVLVRTVMVGKTI